MRLPLFWLRDYLAWEGGAAELAELLTARGLEVEGIDQLGEGTEAVRIARLQSPEPLGDGLRQWEAVLPDRIYRVVSRDPALQDGDLVPLAPVGTNGPWGIVEGLRLVGVQTEGLLLSAEELGLGPGRDGILVLPPEASWGESLVAYLELPNPVLEISLTPSFAAHCQSLLGLAREIAAATGLSITYPTGLLVKNGEFPVPVTVEEPELCPRYAGGLFTGEPNAPSPFWLRRRLWAAGMRTHGAAVDVTNFVMLETGQPLHAFDLDRVEGGEIRVRRARSGERLLTLDGEERELEPADLVIAGRREAAGLAGVMGGLSTEMGPESHRVFLEAALFQGATVRRTSRRLGLLSDAAARFEKGIDPDGVVAALGRALGLLESLGVGRAEQQIFDYYPVPLVPLTVPFRPERAQALLGVELAAAEMLGYLRGLGLGVSGEGPYRVEIPRRRADLSGEVDLVEEVARSYGYDRLPAKLPHGELTRGRLGPAVRLERRLRELALAAGFNEAVTTAFLGPRETRLFPVPTGELLRLLNPLGEDRGILRPSLLPGLLRVVGYNQARGTGDVTLFEIGRVHRSQEGRPVEERHLALLALGRRQPGTWDRPGDWDFYDFKGAIEQILTGAARGEITYTPGEEAALHPFRQANILLDGGRIGVMGEAHPDVVEAFELLRAPLLAELKVEYLQPLSGPTVRSLPRYPAMVRDLALVLATAVPADMVAQAITAAGGQNLVEATLFDVYQGPPVPEGSRSLAYRLTYRSDERTLTETEVDLAQERVRDALRQLGADLRS